MPRQPEPPANEPALPSEAAALSRPRTESTVGSQRAWHWLLVPAGLAAAAAAALSIDVSVSRWCVAGNCPKLIDYFLSSAEWFGNGIGVLLLALVIHQLDPPRRWALPRILATALLAGLAADVCKLLVVRIRPEHFNFEGGVWSTFHGWLPLTSAGSAGQSFPSGHTATAFGLALALSWLYPKGRWLFPAFAALVACQRVESGVHYLSDVLLAAAVGCLVASAFLRVGPIPKLFDALESRWRESRSRAAASRGSKSADV